MVELSVHAYSFMRCSSIREADQIQPISVRRKEDWIGWIGSNFQELEERTRVHRLDLVVATIPNGNEWGDYT